MKILILGGSGLIGRSLINHLLEKNHQIWLLSRNPSKIHLNMNVNLAKWDGLSTFGWSHLVNGLDAFINLAGENIGSKRWNDERKKQIYDSRMITTETVVNAIKKSSDRPKVLIQASAVGLYGPSDEILDENSPPGNDFLARLCVDWENASHPVEELGVRRVIIRTGIVLSAEGGALERVLLPIKWFVGGPLGNGRQWWSWIHITDVVNVIESLLNEPYASGPYNLTSPNPEMMSDFGKTIAAKLHRPYLFPVPSPILQLILGEMSTIILDGQRALPNRLIDLGYQFKFPTLSIAMDDILSK